MHDERDLHLITFFSCHFVRRNLLHILYTYIYMYIEFIDFYGLNHIMFAHNGCRAICLQYALAWISTPSAESCFRGDSSSSKQHYYVQS